MDSKNRLQFRKLRVKVGLSLEEGNCQSRLPIVGMQNSGRLSFQHLECRPAEEGKPFGIIRVVPFRRAVKIITVEILVGLDEIDGYRLTQLRFQHIPFFLTGGDWYAKANTCILERKPALQDATVRRHDKRNPESQPLQH